MRRKPREKGFNPPKMSKGSRMLDLKEGTPKSRRRRRRKSPPRRESNLRGDLPKRSLKWSKRHQRRPLLPRKNRYKGAIPSLFVVTLPETIFWVEITNLLRVRTPQSTASAVKWHSRPSERRARRH